MDQALSPDLEAYWCYLILFSLSLIVAAVQVRQLLKGYANAWATTRAWLLLAAYTAVPVVLFWVLDRADALHDTSLFAAILVALTYRQILSGGSQGFTVPGGLAKAWQPFVTWSDNVAAGISARIARNNGRLDGAVILHLRENAGIYEEVRRIVLNHSVDPGKVQADLDALSRLKPPLDDDGVLERQAGFLYLKLKALPDVDSDRALLDKGVISPWNYYLYAQEWKSKLLVISVLLIAVLSAAALIRGTEVSLGAYQARYYLWRFEKANSTPADQFRAVQHLESGLRRHDPVFTGLVTQELTNRLRFNLLPLDTADRILQLLLNSSLAGSNMLFTQLAGALRTDNADLRVRTEKELVYLAAQRGLAVPAELRAWTPGKQDQPTCVDAAANAWASIATASKASDLACLSSGPEPQAPGQ